MHKVHAMRYTSPRDIYKSRTSTTRASARYAGYLIFDFGFQNLVLVMGSLSPAVFSPLLVLQLFSYSIMRIQHSKMIHMFKSCLSKSYVDNPREMYRSHIMLTERLRLEYSVTTLGSVLWLRRGSVLLTLQHLLIRWSLSCYTSIPSISAPRMGRP